MKTSAILSALAGAFAVAACAPVEPPAAETPPTGDGDTAYVQCQAGDYQELVGRPRSDIPEAPAGRIFRVACTTCPVTMDYRDNRVTFAYDEATGIIRRVSCG